MNEFPIPCYEPKKAHEVIKFKNFSKYVSEIGMNGDDEFGICKIKPPRSWIKLVEDSSKNKPELIEKLIITLPREERVKVLKPGVWNYTITKDKDEMTVKEFRELTKDNQPPKVKTLEELEQIIWNPVDPHPPANLYGVGVSGGLMDETVQYWNFDSLDSQLKIMKEAHDGPLDGVNNSWMYFGKYYTFFAWHKEDQDLGSVNYHHFGAPKVWYSIMPSFNKRFEEIFREKFPDEFRKCPGAMRHKIHILTPKYLRDRGIPVGRTVQKPGEIIVTFPGAYHCGFNAGDNCAEATNFAVEGWLERGKNSLNCTCGIINWKYDVDPWVEKMQSPDIVKEWKEKQEKKRLSQKTKPKPYSKSSNK